MVQNESDEWELVPDTPKEAPLEAPSPTVPAVPDTLEEPTVAPMPSAPPEEDIVAGLALQEQQAKLGTTDDTSPEDIEQLMEKAHAEEAAAEDTPLLASSEEKTTEATQPAPDNAGTEEQGSTAEKEEPQQDTQPNSNPRQEQLPAWLRASLGAATQILKDVDQKHDIKQKTRQSINTVGSSLRQVGDTLQKEGQSIRTVVQQKAEELDIQNKAKTAGDAITQGAKTATGTISRSAKTAGTKAGDAISQGAKTAGAKAKELNKDGKVTDFVAAAAILGAGILLAKGHSGAGAAVLATGGAAYVAAESTNGRRYEPSLNEDLHME